MKKYHYLVLFLIGFLVLWPFMLHKIYTEQEKNTEAFVAREQDDPQESGKNAQGADEAGKSDDAAGTMTENSSAAENGASPGEDTVSGGEGMSEGSTVSGNGAVGPDGAENGGQTENPEVPEEELPPEEFFKDTLFIGDSRTMGLAEYADLNNAAVFASTGMNIYRLYTLDNAVHEQKASLEDILAEKQYRKIYLMLGINELGYDEDQTVKRFEEEVLKLQELQPEAKIILEANLHVTTARSGRDAIFNNAGIDRINEKIRQIAEKYGLAYIDVNELFDDETGGLNPEYTHDEVHVLGKYYQQWADWIRENGV